MISRRNAAEIQERCSNLRNWSFLYNLLVGEDAVCGKTSSLVPLQSKAGGRSVVIETKMLAVKYICIVSKSDQKFHLCTQSSISLLMEFSLFLPL
jgi:hypothetical protein